MERTYSMFKAIGLARAQTMGALVASVFVIASFVLAPDDVSNPALDGTLWQPVHMVQILTYGAVVGAQWVLALIFHLSVTHAWHRVIRMHDHLFFIVGLAVLWASSLTCDRLMRLMGGEWVEQVQLDPNTAISGRNDSHYSCNVYVAPAWAPPDAGVPICFNRGYELQMVLVVVTYMSFLSACSRMRPRLYLILVHWAAACHLAARGLLGDLDSDPLQKVSDTVCLYLLLVTMWIGVRRHDSQLRAAFLASRQLQTRVTELNDVVVERTMRLSVLEERERTRDSRKSEPPYFTWERQVTGKVAALLHEELVTGLSPTLRDAWIAPEELRVASLLGQGAHGVVNRAVWRGAPVAVKKQHYGGCGVTRAALRAFKAECSLMLELHHPNIVATVGVSWHELGGLEDIRTLRREPCLSLVLELCARGTLEDLLMRSREASELSWSAQKLPIAVGVAQALSYLHAQEPPLLHRDLKPSNVLIDGGYNPKICDLGSTRELSSGSMTYVGTLLYLPPEALRNERYTEKLDVWSFGCLLEVLWTHKQLYGASSPDGAWSMSSKSYSTSCSPAEDRRGRGAVRRSSEPEAASPSTLVHRVAEGRLSPEVPPGCFLAPLLARCVDQAPDGRPAFDEIISELKSPLTSAAAMRVPPGPGGWADATHTSPPASVSGARRAPGESTSGRSSRASGRPSGCEQLLPSSLADSAGGGKSSSAAQPRPLLLAAARSRSASSAQVPRHSSPTPSSPFRSRPSEWIQSAETRSGPL